MIDTRYAILPLLLFATSAPGAAQVEGGRFVDPLRRALPAPEYVRRAAAHDLYQRQAAQLILRNSHSPEVRRIAQTMIADHARASAELRAAAAKAGIRINAALSTVEYRELVGKLTLASADARDTLYLAQQRSVHQRSLAMHQDYAKGGDDPTLKETAARLAAIEQAHIELVDSIGTVLLPVSGATQPAP